jgi:hypothetical protein
MRRPSEKFGGPDALRGLAWRDTAKLSAARRGAAEQSTASLATCSVTTIGSDVNAWLQSVVDSFIRLEPVLGVTELVVRVIAGVVRRDDAEGLASLLRVRWLRADRAACAPPLLVRASHVSPPLEKDEIHRRTLLPGAEVEK